MIELRSMQFEITIILIRFKSIQIRINSAFESNDWFEFILNDFELFVKNDLNFENLIMFFNLDIQKKI